jgi:cell division protein FtsB
LVGSVGGGLVLIAAMFAFYFPTRTWLSQRHQTDAAAGQLARLQTANKQLAANLEGLKDPATIERIARGEYNMVRPGEKAYVVLPPSAGPTTLPQVWPFADG